MGHDGLGSIPTDPKKIRKDRLSNLMVEILSVLSVEAFEKRRLLTSYGVLNEFLVRSMLAVSIPRHISTKVSILVPAYPLPWKVLILRKASREKQERQKKRAPNNLCHC